jgi:hypothetical protein
MLVSRGTGALRCILTKLNQPNLRQGTQLIRKSHDAVYVKQYT